MKFNFLKPMIGFTALVAIITTLAGCSISSADKADLSNQQVSSKPIKLKSTPTLFFHGWGSSYHAEHQMAQAAVKSGASTQIIRAQVSSQGKVSLIGKITPHAKNPIVEVGYTDNQNPNYQTDGRWARNVVVKLQQQYQIRKFNMVGHSMGNMAIVYYLLANAQNQHLPKLQKQVDIAGHFNGILGEGDVANRMKLKKDGRPTKIDANYRQLLTLRKSYPKNQVRVLNIYGDKDDGSHSDGDVSNASSKSLRYLVAGRAKSYREAKIVGSNAQHSKLHENKKVDQLLSNFLWK